PPPPQRMDNQERFTIEGIHDGSNSGKAVILEGSGFKGFSPEVDDLGHWQVQFVFTQAGNKTLTVTIGRDRKQFDILVNNPRRFSLSGSVGYQGTNRNQDVLAVKKRLNDLGYTWVNPTTSIDTGTLNAIRLFQAIINQHYQVRGSGVDGRVDPNGFTHSWLEAKNAPRWQLMPVDNVGLFNYERQIQTADNHDYGTNWMADTLINAGQDYQRTYLDAHPQAAQIVINDVSVPYGGDTPDHATHETGMSCDILLPRQSGGYMLPTWQDSRYDRDAMRAILKSIRRQPLTSRVLFNDPQLIQEGLCIRATGHDNHVHFEVRPPARAN
ncbi:MAG: peptidoglycan-binding protein, partial [Kamptonema sp. SIO4C4]|nr:peptidoglycan-binding protein [Kamptonema sp. SIO4C4]